MESFLLIVTILMVLGGTIPKTEAGIFDPIRNIFDPAVHNEDTPAKVFNSFLPPFRSSSEIQGSPTRRPKGRSLRNSRAWWAMDSTPKAPLIQNIFNDPSTTTPDYDKIVAERFPEATDLLEKLKELNRLKEEQKQKEIAGGNEFGRPTSKPPIFGGQTTPPYDNGNGGQSAEKITPDGKLIMRPITKRHFYFQAVPVRPEGEDNSISETIYYVDM
ncbi:uncharacterized protein LOC142976967 [Anticarsia gemmatalis]|uniref:uncharacterized protein LOC142976967 n=1 Tax=Anticarsia gemmatalis TaxID=129554 RepID=UPI003F774AEC